MKVKDIFYDEKEIKCPEGIKCEDKKKCKIELLHYRLDLLFKSNTWWLSWWLCPRDSEKPYICGGIDKSKFYLKQGRNCEIRVGKNC